MKFTPKDMTMETVGQTRVTETKIIGDLKDNKLPKTITTTIVFEQSDEFDNYLRKLAIDYIIEE